MNPNCICKNRSPIEQYTVISKAEYIYLLETVNRQSAELEKEKKDEIS